jgi:hypothetical protein
VKTKHIIHFPKWTNITKLNESLEDYNIVKAEAQALTTELNEKIGPSLTTAELMKWFKGLLNLYNQGKYQTFIYIQMQNVVVPNYTTFERIFTKKNTDLKLDDIEAIKFFKGLTQIEPTHIRDTNAKLKELGFI